MKKIFTLFFLITVIFIAIQPSPNNSKISYGETDFEMTMRAVSKNYNTIDNFIFQYKNTISGWFGKSVNDYNRSYLSEGFVNGNWFLMFGKFLPYLCILVIIILFLRDWVLDDKYKV